MQFMQYLNADFFTTEFQRDVVVTELKKAEILEEFLEGPEGKIVLDFVLDSVRNNMSKIVNLSAAGFDENISAIKQAAFKIKIAHEFMYSLVVILDRGQKHEELMMDITNE